MGLERRDGNLYYYRHERDDETVRKVYVASGELARTIAEREQAERTMHKHRREQECKELERLNALAAPVLELDELTGVLARAALVDAGYRRYQGKWRMRRDENS